MKPIEVTDPLAHSADLTAEKIDQLRQLFPEAITEDASGRKVDFDVLRGLLGSPSQMTASTGMASARRGAWR